MNWYVAKIVYEIICGKGEHCAQFDEQLRLVCAEDFAGALHEAICIGKQEATSFANDKGQLVQWNFFAVPELFPLVEYMHGAELLSRIREVDQVQEYKTILHARAVSLQQNQNTCPPYHFLT